jgi:hypothetical protein
VGLARRRDGDGGGRRTSRGTRRRPLRAALAVTAGCAVLAGTACGGPADAGPSPTPSGAGTTGTGTTASPATSGPATAQPATTPATVPPLTTSPVTGGARLPPAWLGTRVLPTNAQGYGIAAGTPPELRDRRFVTVDLLAPPADGRFHATVAAVPPEVVLRSTWGPDCPVALRDLRYVTVTFRGFDGRAHTGELIVHRTVASAAVTVFRRLFAADFPIERMRVTTVEERDAAPTGDGNNTGSFSCRSAVATTSWSQHAYGTAIDVNPFQNPYVKGSLVLPELAGDYTDRARRLPGMITPGGPVVAAFRSVGWRWGGNWRSSKDYMHFSVNGR